LELIRLLTREIGSGKAMSLTVVEEMNCVLKLEEDRKGGMIQNVTTKLFSCVVIKLQLRQQQLRLQQLRQQRKPVTVRIRMSFVKWNLLFCSTSFAKSTLLKNNALNDATVVQNLLRQQKPLLLPQQPCPNAKGSTTDIIPMEIVDHKMALNPLKNVVN